MSIKLSNESTTQQNLNEFIQLSFEQSAKQSITPKIDVNPLLSHSSKHLMKQSNNQSSNQKSKDQMYVQESTTQ